MRLRKKDIENFQKLSAVETACYLWPEDSDVHRGMRQCYMHEAGKRIAELPWEDQQIMIEALVRKRRGGH